MNALVANLVTCAHGRCSQPGVVMVPLGTIHGSSVELEFCDRHAFEHWQVVAEPDAASGEVRRAPAAAYSAVAAVVGDDYMATPPPSAGMRVSVMGADGVPVVWDCDNLTAQAIAATVRLRRDLRWVGAVAYDEQPAG